jgi:hypothetical protein
MTTGGGLAGSLPRLSRRWHYRGGRRRILGGSAQGGGVAIAQHPKTEVVQRVGVAVIDRCERLSITGRGGTRQLAIAVHLPIRWDGHGIAFCELSPGFRHIERVPTRYNPVTSSALLESPSGARAGGAHNSPMRPARAVGWLPRQ